MTPGSDPTTNQTPPGDGLQFQTAETPDTRRRCTSCQSVLTGSYYHVAGLDTCRQCAEVRRTWQDLPDSPQKFVRALLYGGGAALAGLIAWSAFTIITGWQIGLLAIAVGWLVGTAIRRATGGHTSRKYQILAVVLTYLAISMSFLPRVVAEQVKQQKAAAEVKKNTPPGTKTQVVPKPAQPESPVTNPIAALLIFLGACLISPFLEAFYAFPSGIIGLFILFLALQRASVLVKPDDALIIGPYELPVEENA